MTAYKADVVKSMGSRFNLSTVAQNLFRLLREVDAEGVDVIVAEGVPSGGFGFSGYESAAESFRLPHS